MSQLEETPTMALLDGRYQLRDCVGQGGMANVYRAEDLMLGRTVAIKMMRTDAELLASPARARTEMTVLASLNHPSLVKLLDARLVPGSPGYLVMEFVDGATLSDRLRQGALPPADVAHLACELASALHAVHQAGVVHRDVKPSNILLARAALPSHPFHAKLTDFGVAYLMDSTHLTSPGTVVGTAAFLAPEQVRGQAAHPAADVYALGLVLLEAITGERAFPQASGIGAVMARLVESPAIPDRLGPAWVDLLRRMTALDPALRPTALEVASRAQALPIDVVSPVSVAPAPIPAPVSALSAVSAAGREETVTQPLSGLSRRPVGHRARPKSTPRWIAAAALVGSAAAAVLALQLGSWTGEAAEQPPALVATVPTQTEPDPAPAPVVAEEPVDAGGGGSEVPVEPASLVHTDGAEEQGSTGPETSTHADATQPEEAAKQAEQAAKHAAQAQKKAEEAQQRAAEDARKREDEARKQAEDAQESATQENGGG